MSGLTPFSGEEYPEVVDPGPEGNPTITDEEDRTAKLLALVKGGDWLDEQVFPPTQWAVPGVIPEGFGLLTGPPKIGKSWAVLGIALALSAGTMAFGHISVGPPRPVLYLALEDGEKRLQWRSRELLGEGVPIPAAFQHVTEVNPNDVIPLIIAWLNAQARGCNPLVILDTLGKVMPPANPGEGAYQRDYRIGGVLKRVVKHSPGCTLLVVHHVRKGSASDWMDSTSGTNGLNGSADFTVNIHRERNDSEGLLRVTGRDVSEAEYGVECVDGRWLLVGDSLAEAAEHAVEVKATIGLSDVSAKIVDFVARMGEVAPKDVEAALNLSEARQYLSRLEKAGRLVKPSRGRYSLPPVSQAVPVTTVTLSQSDDSLDTLLPLRGGGVSPQSDNVTVVTPAGSDTCAVCGTTLSLMRAAYSDRCRDCSKAPA